MFNVSDFKNLGDKLGDKIKHIAFNFRIMTAGYKRVSKQVDTWRANPGLHKNNLAV